MVGKCGIKKKLKSLRMTEFKGTVFQLSEIYMRAAFVRLQCCRKGKKNLPGVELKFT